MNSDKNPNPNPKPTSSPILDRFSARLKEREQKLGRCKTLDIVSLYEDVLVELTTNSKPVITDLSIIADQQKEHAEGIANAICDWILKVAMEQKLPSLYLLDSIVKNVGCEYKSLFASRLYEVFVVTYRQLHPSFHPSMLRLFKTWPLYFPASVLSKIEAELQFTLQEYQNQSCSSYSGQSGSQSSRLVHSIHVNPKYLDECHRSEHPGVDAPHARHPPNLQSHRQKSSLQLPECNLDHHELHPPLPRFERTGTIGMAGVKDMLSYSRPSSPPRVWSTIDSFPERVVSRPSLSSIGAGKPNDWSGGLERSGPFGDSVQIPEASGAHNHNNGYDKLRARLLIEAYGSEDPSSEKLPKFQRLDFNGTSSNITTKDLRSSEEEYAWECMSPTLSNQSKQYKPTPFGHVAGLTRVNTACVGKEFRSDWHNQASLARSDDRANVIANSGHRSFSNKCQNDLASHKEQWTRYQQIYHAQEPLKFSSDLPQSSQQITHPRPQGKMLQVPRSENGMIPIGQKTTTTSPFNDARHLSFEDACQAEVPFNRISNSCSESSKCEASIIERHLAQKENSPHSTSVLWPPIRKSQPLPLLTVPSHEQQFKSSFDLEANKPIANVTPDPPLFLHRQQFDRDDKTTSLNVQSLEQRTNVPVEYREAQSLSGPVEPSLLSPHLVPHSSSHMQEQGGVVPSVLPNLPCGLAFPNPPLQPPLCSSHSLHLHPLRPVSATTAIAAAVPLPLPVSFPLPHPLPNPIHPAASLTHICTSSYPLPNLSFPLTAQNNSISSMYQPSGPLPPLPLGPPHASLQLGSDSQRTTAVVSESPASAYSGLISSLMAQGLISLIPLDPSQDAVGIDFNVELLKVRHESSINSLYGDLSRQCTTCGMRFKCQEEHSSHMDWHVTKNRIAKNHKQKPSRNWYVSEKEWLSGAEALGTDVVPGLFLTEAVVEKKKDKEVAVPADENQPTCALCGEPFEDFYSDEMEEWLYRGAVYLNAPNGLLEGIERSKLGPIVHAKCQPESAANS